MKYKILICLNIFFMAFLTALSSQAALENSDVDELNDIFHKTYSREQWENLKRLYLPRLPESQFPASFEKLKNLSIIDLLPEAQFVDCYEQNLGPMRHKSNANLHEAFKGQEICLSGRKFKVVDKKGQGKMAHVYIIENPTTQDKYALTRYDYVEGNNTAGAKLVLSKARKSKNLINLPLLVNSKEEYIISPLMMGEHVRNDSSAHNRFFPNGGCEKLIREDGIWSGIDTHSKNYMYLTPKSTLPKVIDFRTFRPLVGAPVIPKYGPQLSASDKDLAYCKKIYDEETSQEKPFVVPSITTDKPIITPVIEPQLKPIDKEQCAKECYEQLAKCIANPTPQLERHFVCGKQFTLCFNKCQ